MTDQPDPDRRKHAIAFNALDRALKDARIWLPFTGRQAAVDAVLEALDADDRDTARQTAPHVCGNCDGIDPDTCLANPDRAPAVGQPAEAQATEALTADERKFLHFALDLAFDALVSGDGFTNEDDAAYAKLRRMAGKDER